MLKKLKGERLRKDWPRIAQGRAESQIQDSKNPEAQTLILDVAEWTPPPSGVGPIRLAGTPR